MDTPPIGTKWARENEDSPFDVRIMRDALVFGAAFFLAYLYGMQFHHTSSSPFWPPDAVLLSALLLTPPKRWWLFLLLTLPIRWFVAVPAGTPAWFLIAAYVNDSVKALLGAIVLRRWSRRTPRLDSMQELVRFVAMVVVATPMLSAFAGAYARTLLAGDDYWSAWQR